MLERRILRGLLPLSLAASFGLPTAAEGQSMMDREGPPPRVHASSPAELLRAAACVAAAGSPLGAAILASLPGSAEERRAAEAFLREGARCLRLPSPLITSTAILRGAVAESLYEAQFPAPTPTRTPAIPVAPMPRPPGQSESGTAYALAECVAATRQDLVRDLLASVPSTSAEQAAVQRLEPAFAPCARPDAPLRIESEALRGLLAEALYRWSVVQRDGPTSPWAAASGH